MRLSMRLEGARGNGIQRFRLLRLLNRLRERDRIGVLGPDWYFFILFTSGEEVTAERESGNEVRSGKFPHHPPKIGIRLAMR